MSPGTVKLITLAVQLVPAIRKRWRSRRSKKATKEFVAAVLEAVESAEEAGGDGQDLKSLAWAMIRDRHPEMANELSSSERNRLNELALAINRGEESEVEPQAPSDGYDVDLTITETIPSTARAKTIKVKGKLTPNR